MALSTDAAAAGSREAEFCSFVVCVEPGLRRALVAAFGPEAGAEAVAEALAWAWQHFDALREMNNPGGYLWRVGQSSLRPRWRRRRFEVPNRRPASPAVTTASEAWDNELVRALGALPRNQRVAVVLVHAYGYSLAEAATALGCGVSSLRNHLRRGLGRLRRLLEEDDRR